MIQIYMYEYVLKTKYQIFIFLKILNEFINTILKSRTVSNNYNYKEKYIIQNLPALGFKS